MANLIYLFIFSFKRQTDRQKKQTRQKLYVPNLLMQGLTKTQNWNISDQQYLPYI